MSRFCYPGRRLAAFSIVLGAGLVGCSGPTVAPVHGTVRLPDGSLAKGVILSFEDAENHTLARAVTGDDGTYVLTTGRTEGRVPFGNYKVAVRHSPVPDSRQTAGSILFPLRYQSFETSGLQFIVQDGDNLFDIDLRND